MISFDYFNTEIAGRYAGLNYPVDMYVKLKGFNNLIFTNVKNFLFDEQGFKVPDSEINFTLGYFSGGIGYIEDTAYAQIIPNSKTFLHQGKWYALEYYAVIVNKDIILYANSADDSVKIDGKAVLSDLDKLIYYNRRIYENCIFGNEIIKKCESLKISVPQSFYNDIQTLHDNVIQRNNDILKVTENKGFQFSKAIGIAGIGLVISTTTAIIVGIVTIGLTALAVYLLTKHANPEAKMQWEYSNKLTENLKKYLPADVYNQLIKENNGLQKVANQLIADNKQGIFGQIGTTLKVVGIAAGAFLLVSFAKDSKIMKDLKQYKNKK